MRRVAFLWSALIICGILLGLHTFYTHIGLLFETGARDIISKQELEYSYGNLTAGTLFAGSRKQLIPKIIHQTWKNISIPLGWQEPVKKCHDLHPDYNYMLWTDEKARAFLVEHYPLFVSTYDKYPYNIERADVIRYFVLHHYGGTYIDMDLGCMRSLDALNQYPFWAHLTNPTGISNDAMGSIPNHIFWELGVIPALPTHDFRYPIPYITVMASTGPLFLSAIWKRWIDSTKNVNDGQIRVMSREDFSGEEGIFKMFHGSSWHEEDVTIIMWGVKHWFIFAILLALVAVMLWSTMRGRSARRRRRDGKSYELVERHEV